MDFSLSTEQQLLRDSLSDFLAARYSVDKSRLAAKTGPGWQPDIWRAFAYELGILDAVAPGAVEDTERAVNTLIICEALGHALVIEPYIETAIIAAGLLHRADTAATTDLILRICGGDAIVALATAEPRSGYEWTDVTTEARWDGDHHVLNGRKSFVLHAPIATHLLVTARTLGDRHDHDGISLFRIDLADPPAGIDIHPYRTVDDRRAADIIFTDVQLPNTASIGQTPKTAASLALARDEGTLAVCAEAVGCMRKVLADTIEYCRQREQFGQPIGRFQVVQHRIVDMHIEIEQAAAALYLPLMAGGKDEVSRARTTSATKATVSRAARFVSQNAIQLHGAMGMTEELPIGHYCKRLTAFLNEFGSADYHLARYATLGPTA